MILIAFALCALAAIVLIALSHTNLQMNAAAVGQAIVYLVITVYILLFVQIPVNTFIVGSGTFSSTTSVSWRDWLEPVFSFLPPSMPGAMSAICWQTGSWNREA